MTTGYVLIVAILVLGGVIATVGDRIGMKVGKARLTLFNLRPRQTATLVSVLTGGVISASTLAILFGISSQLRTGVFELGEIQDNLEQAQTELQQVQRDRQAIEQALITAQTEQQEARSRLRVINDSLTAAIARQTATQDQLDQTDASYQRAQAQLRSVTQQEQRLRQAVQRLEQERQTLIQREQAIRVQIEQRDQEIAQQENAISAQRQSLDTLAIQQNFLSQEVQRLEREAAGLRQGDVALARNQVLTSGVLRVVQPEAAPQAIGQLLREANRVAYRNIWPLPGVDMPDAQLIRITNLEVERLIQTIQGGEEFVIRVLSGANYVVGEPCVLEYVEPCIQIFIDAVPNTVVFEQGDIVATTPIEATSLTDRYLLDRLNLLVATSQFRSRQAGVVADTLQIADGSSEAVVNFLEQVRQYNQPLDLQAIAAERIYAAGPVQIDLFAVQNGRVLFRSDQPAAVGTPNASNRFRSFQ